MVKAILGTEGDLFARKQAPEAGVVKGPNRHGVGYY